MKKTPICIISFNRALYLNSLLHSLENELEDFDIVLVDNGSKESKMNDVIQKWQSKIHVISLKGDDWINDEYKAKNAFLEYCENRYSTESYLFLQDDMQYIGPKGKLIDHVKKIDKTDFLNVSITGVRKSTILSTFSNKKVDNIWQLKDNHFGTIGIHKKSVFQKVGWYTQNFPTQKEFWGRGEDDYHNRVVQKYSKDYTIAGFYHVPLFIGVWNDPRGHYSFIRNGKRYGHYLPPVDNKKYYENLSEEHFDNLLKNKEPASFVDVASPIGWSFAKTADGDQQKYSQASIMLEGPVQDIK